MYTEIYITIRKLKSRTGQGAEKLKEWTLMRVGESLQPCLQNTEGLKKKFVD